MQENLALKQFDIPDSFAPEAKAFCRDLISYIERTEEEHNIEIERKEEAYDQKIEWLKQRFKIIMQQLRPDLISREALSTLFDEAESNDDENIEYEVDDGSEPDAKKTKKKRKKKKKAIPDHLPRTIKEHDLPEDAKRCTEDGEPLANMGFDVKEELVYHPARFEVIEHRFPKYVCKSCEGKILRQPSPKTLIPGSYASAGLLAHIAVSKYCNHLPLYRLEKIFGFEGIHLTRQVQSEWMIKLGHELAPLIGIMHEEILSSPVVSADETPVRLLTKDGVRTSTQCYMWQLSRWGPKPLVLFEYDQTRSKAVAERLLKDYEGYVQVDGYAGYNILFGEDSPRKRVGCAAHCLRKFKDYRRSLEKEHRPRHSVNKITALFDKLYDIEEDFREKNLTPEQRFDARRQSEAESIIDDLLEMIEQELEDLSTESPYYEALHYSQNELPLVKRYLENGAIEIDNNFAENAIRPFALGRRNWLFICSEQGAQASANIYSLLISAKANGLNPYDYMKKVIEKLPHCETADDYAELLPTA